MTPRRRHARANPTIDGCIFNCSGEGIKVRLQEDGSIYYSNASTYAIIQNNLFMNLLSAAVNVLHFSSRNYGTPFIVNNTIIDCERGIWNQADNIDAVTINNIIYGTSTAIERTGNNSSTTFFNCLYNNGVNFFGYPSAYGDIVMTNENGDSCDMGFNIYQDPLFEDTQFQLMNGSPCCNAGKDSIEVDTWYHAPDHDFIGNPRPMPALTKPDIGAWEKEQETGIDSNPTVSLPAKYSLSQNYPNPFNAATTIIFSLTKPSEVEIEIYDLLGRKVELIYEGKLPAGEHQTIWNAMNHTSGMYFYRIQAGDYTEAKQMVLLK